MNLFILCLCVKSLGFFPPLLLCPPSILTGVGGFLPGMKQIANVAALPGIVGVSENIHQWNTI